jgi:hypothetical protein
VAHTCSPHLCVSRMRCLHLTLPAPSGGGMSGTLIIGDMCMQLQLSRHAFMVIEWAWKACFVTMFPVMLTGR